MRIHTLISSLILWCCSLSATAQIHVTVSGAGSRNGSGWANAISAAQLQPTLRNAAPGSEFWIAGGTYKPHTNSRDTSFVIPSKVKVYGGWAGNETSLDNRDWRKNTTILSGDIGIPGDTSDNSYTVVSVNKADSNTLIDGCTITGGNANRVNDVGGGMVVTSSAIRIRNCTIIENTAKIGGGIYLSGGFHLQKLRLENCIIEKNHADKEHNSNVGSGGGGGIYSNAASPIIQNCIFRKNSTSGHGGAYHIFSNLMYTSGDHFDDCLFEENFSDGGGGAIMSLNDTKKEYTITINNCRFISNEANGVGGASSFYLKGGNPNINIQNSTFEDNTANAHGAAIYYITRGGTEPQSYPTTSYFYCYNNVFINNIPKQPYFGNSLTFKMINTIDTTIMINCLFYNSRISNHAELNGKRNLYMINCTMYGDMKKFGGGYFIHNNSDSFSVPTVTPQCLVWLNNSIIWHDNKAQPSNTQPIILNTGPGSLYTSVKVKNSLIKTSGGSGNWNFQPGWITDLGKNIDIDPRFVDTSYNFANLRLRCNSPALNRGDNALAQQYTGIDLDGNPRIAYGTVDMGAYENDKKSAIAKALANHIHSGYYIFTANTPVYDSLKWDLGDGTTSTHPLVSHTYKQDKTYTVCLKVYSSCGNADTCFQVNVTKTGVTNAPSSTLIFYPNPANDKIIIDGTSSEGHIKLTDVSGRCLLNIPTSKNKTIISTGNIPSGIYLLELSDPTGKRSVSRCVINH